MSDQIDMQTPFETRRVISDAFAIFKLGVKPLAILFGVVALVDVFIVEFLSGLSGSSTLQTGTSIGSLILSVAAAGAATRVLHSLGYGQPANLKAAIDEAAAKLLPLFVVNVACYLAIAVGTAALVVPGLWLIGLTCVVVPLIMIENSGFTAFSRTVELTEGYRWYAVLAIVGLLAPVVLVGVILLTLAGTSPAFASGGFISTFPFTIMQIAFTIITSGLLTAVSLSIHKRLTDIKGGVGPTDVAEIFD